MTDKEVREEVDRCHKVSSKFNRMDHDLKLAFSIHGLKHPKRWMDLMDHIENEISEIERELSS